MKSLTTFLIPCFNGEDYIRAAVDSCLTQTRPAEEIIVTDDASTDSSTQILEEYEARGQITLIRNSKNLGKADSLNAAISQVHTPFIAMMDADDISEPQRLERQIAYLTENPKIGAVAGFTYYINSQGRIFGEGKVVSPRSLCELETYLKSGELFGLHYSGVTVRTEVFQDPDLRFHREFFPAEDTDLWNRIAEKGWGVIALPEFFSHYRVHPASAWSSKFMTARQTYHYMRECMRARRAGKPEPSRAEFDASLKEMGPLARWNRWRKDMAKGLYRSAGFARGNGDWAVAGILFVRALVFQPSYVLPRIFRQLGR